MAEDCLRGLTILCEATTADLQQKLHRIITSLGGTASTSKDASGKSKASLLVADSVLCEAYKMTSDRPVKFPRVLPSWLEACKESGRKVAIKGHDLKVFTGLTASISGAFTKEKHKYAEMFAQHGGTYCAEMTKLCTHLVLMKQPDVKRSMSVKEMHARVWGDMFIVWESWVVSCIKTGVYQAQEAEHLVPECNDPAYRDFLEKHKVLQVGKQATAAPNKASSKLDTGATEAASERDGSKQSQGSIGRRPAGILDTVEATRSASDGGVASCEDEDDTLFLSGALVHLACCTPDEQLEMLRILREGGCTRRPDLRNDVTHVVVGSDLTAAEVQAIGEHAKKFGHVSAIVTLDWLRQCLAERSLAPTDKAMTLNAASLAASVLQQKAARSDQASKEAPAGTQAMQGKASQAATQRKGCLEGLFFTLAALKIEGEDEQYSRKAIRQAGGRTFDRRTLDLVVAKDKAYAICPPSLPQPELTRLMKQNPDFRLVPERNRVTPSWLDVSLDMQQPLNPIPSHRVELQPLPHPVPYPGMAKVKITASNLTPDEKDSMKRIVNILGGQYSVKMGHSNTHLVVPYAAGDKYQGAVRYNVLPVTCSWIIDVARAGKLLPESKYRPPPFEGGLQPEQSQFPFELPPRPTQDPAKPASDKPSQAPSLLRQVMTSSQQPPERSTQDSRRGLPKGVQGAARSKQGPSKLDALFSQLHTPVKGLKPPTANPAAVKDLPRPPPQDSQAAGRKEDRHTAHDEVSVGPEDQDDDLREPLEAAAQLRAQGVGSADEMADILEDVERLGGALAELPHQLSPSSQQDPPLQYHKGKLPATSLSSDGFASKGNSQDGKSRLKRSTRAGDSVSEDSHPGRAKRTRSLPRHPRANSENLPNDIQPSQACSQEVGYEGVIKAGQPYMIDAGRDLRSSRRHASSSSTGRAE